MNVLITNIGRRNYLVEFLKQTESFRGNVFVTDCDNTASGLYGNNDGYFILSKPIDDEKKYINELLNVCLLNKIDIVVPIIDPEIYILSKYTAKFKEHNIMIIVSEFKVLEICYNKIKMNQFLRSNGFYVIQTFTCIEDFKEELQKGTIKFPVFVKQATGSGSQEAFYIENSHKLNSLFKEGMIIQEYLHDEEYGVDIFNNMTMNPVRIVIKKKLLMRSGETDKSITVYDEEIFNISKKLGEKLKHLGPLDCDMIKYNGKIYIIDLNPRFGGGYPATHMAGVNFLELIIKMYNNIDILPKFNNYKINQLTAKDIGIATINLV